MMPHADRPAATTHRRSLATRPARRLVPRLAVVVLAGLLTACGGGQAGATGGAPSPRRRSDVIADAEIRALEGRVLSVLEVITFARPAMLRSRAGTTSASSDGSSAPNAGIVSVLVYLDGQRLGEVRVLDTIDPATVSEIRYLNASDATTRFGTGHPAGAIMLTSRRR